jgi:hypothetical protein
MRYLVKARIKSGKAKPLLRAIESGTLGEGSIAGDEYIYDMQQARQLQDGAVCWVETCFCATPLEEEKPYWEEYFDLLKIKNAHDPRRCKDLNGSEPWACCDCDCTKKLEEKMAGWGESFLATLEASGKSSNSK